MSWEHFHTLYKTDPANLTPPLNSSIFKMDWWGVRNCYVVRGVKTLNSFCKLSSLKMRETTWLLISAQFKSHQIWWYKAASVHMTTWVTCTLMLNNIQVSMQHRLPSTHCFSGKALIISDKLLCASIRTTWLCNKGQVVKMSCLQSQFVTHWKYLLYYKIWYMTKDV